MKIKAEIVEMPELRVAAVPHHGPYSEIAAAFGPLGQIAGAAGLFVPSAAMLGIYYDDPRTTPAAELRSDAGITISEGVVVPQGLVERRIPAGRFARAVHVGPYEQLPELWQSLMGEWLPRSGRKQRDGASLEIYRNNPHTAPKEELITEVYIPVG